MFFICLAFCSQLVTGARLHAWHVHGHDVSARSKSGVASQMTLEEMKAIDNSMASIKDANFSPKPFHHLKRKLMKKMKHANVSAILDKIGKRMPDEELSLVKSTLHTRSQDPEFSEKSIAKARKILNGMVEEAQGRLDLKEIECKEFYQRNRLAWEAARADQARLAEQITDLIRLIGESEQGIQTATDDIDALEADRSRQEKEFLEMKAEDDLEMKKRMDDLAVAEFILSFTICNDKKPPTMLLSPEHPSPNEHASSSLNTLTCSSEEGELEMHFEDPKLEAQAQKLLTPGARAKLRLYLSEGNAEQMHDDLMEQEDSLQAGADDSSKVAERIASARQLIESRKAAGGEQADDEAVVKPPHHHSHQHQKYHHKHHRGIKHKAAALTQTREIPVIEGAVPSASKTQSKKCVLGKPNCGLLHDNMSLMWGKFKDAVDELKAKMDHDAQNWEDIKADINQQIETLVTAKASYADQLNEAVAKKASDVEEQQDKSEEERLLQKEFKMVMAECRSTIYEITYTDICGVLTVRGEISKFSEKVTPDDIQDCEFGDLEPGPCSITCDDMCIPHDMSQCVGGSTILTREIVQERNEFGHKCPKLQYKSKCGQIRCPVNCGMSSWSGWTKCTKECETGTRIRTRSVVAKPKNGGDKCDTTGESQLCNTGSCDRDCSLKEWTPWSPCTQACGGGSQAKMKHIRRPTRGNGKCPNKKNLERYEQRRCNTHPCVGDELCIAKMDFIVAVDGSGSLRESGYEVLKEFAAKLVSRFKGEKYGSGAAKVGVVQFGNGMILKDRTISPAKLIDGLSDDTEAVAEKIKKTVWEKGFTNLAQAFATAEKIQMNSGRADVPTTIIVISDGKPSFKFETWNKVKEAKDKGIRVVMVILNDALGKEDRKFMRELASGPENSNVVMIPGVKRLKGDMDTWVTHTLTNSCPRSESPSKMEDFEEMSGYEKVRENQWCGEDFELHEYVGFAHDAAQCYALALKAKATHFSLATDMGEGPMGGGCFAERTKDGDKCPEEFVPAPVNYYKILKSFETEM